MQNAENKTKYDLVERTSIFGQKVINFCKTIKQDTITRPLVGQLIRSGTSIGANYCEADEASSKKDFINKMCIAKKEIKETRYWLRMVEYTIPTTRKETNLLLDECRQLNLIFSTIINNTRSKFDH